ncbi:MAG: hypothetical protein KF847_12295 [Pirellulales bacterium]|nr:hypothetical protein [Pirellulales bacterium]
MACLMLAFVVLAIRRGPRAALLTIAASLSLALSTAQAAPFVPGTGVKVPGVGDDMEDPNWRYVPNGAKASYEQDEQQRPPGGYSTNGRWYESAMRGQPDVVKRIATPPGGLAGSKGSLLLVTRLSGVPGELAHKKMQDDLLLGVKERLGRPIAVNWQPSCVVRVYLPEWDRWEQRSGSSFGFRADVRGRKPNGDSEAYWPGMFISFHSSTSKQFDHDHAQILVRADEKGRDVDGPIIEEPGWITLGLSFTPDGQVHYYARPGVEDLTEEDCLYSSRAYGNRCLYVDAIFFNVANFENGKNWSTPWVVDDPMAYVIPPQGQRVENLGRGAAGSTAGRSPSKGLMGLFRK